MDDRITSGDRRPVQKRIAKRGWTKAKRVLFLSVLADSCNVKRAAAAAGMTAAGVYQLRRRDPAFGDLWAEALEAGYERLENALLEHALIGVNAINMGDVLDAEPVDGTKIVPGSGVSARALTPATVQLAMSLLSRHRQSVDGRAIAIRGKRATPEETDAALKKQLDALARKLNKGKPEGDAPETNA